MTEIYEPTLAERENTLLQGDFLKVSGDGVFATLQGEGVSAGTPSVFLRLQNCNLHCGANGKGWRCDAWYTWDRETPEYWQETTNVPVEELAETITTAWDDTFADESPRRLVITGGEPLLQQRKLPPLLARLAGWEVEVETNGTVAPIDELRRAQINCSPKLASSGNELRARRRAGALRTIADFPNHWFKFVIGETLEEDVEEVKEIVESIGIDPQRVLLMSEGTAVEQLRQRDERLVKVAQALGCGMTARNHVFWFGDTRAT